MRDLSTPDRSETHDDGTGSRNRAFRVLMPLRNAIAPVLVAIRRSFLLFVAAVGLVLIVLGISPLVDGLFAGMFGIWGATAILCAGLGFVVLRFLEVFDV